ncbi:hypothetical protein OIU84_021844 [Salix udensis]|uniref:Uncharacterized protein n=1 Tax=Salix udensis TaxID=889485 RepID=A0AAD6KVT2_9ROSI|nr:hypothetical protein OIU84_021844 [Salix udensis]
MYTIRQGNPINHLINKPTSKIRRPRGKPPRRFIPIMPSEFIKIPPPATTTKTVPAASTTTKQVITITTAKKTILLSAIAGISISFRSTPGPPPSPEDGATGGFGFDRRRRQGIDDDGADMEGLICEVNAVLAMEEQRVCRT